MPCESGDGSKCELELRRQRHRKLLCWKLAFIVFVGLLIAAFGFDLFGLRNLNLEPPSNNGFSNKKVFGERHGVPAKVPLEDKDKENFYNDKPENPGKSPKEADKRPTESSSAAAGGSGSAGSFSAAVGDSELVPKPSEAARPENEKVTLKPEPVLTTVTTEKTTTVEVTTEEEYDLQKAENETPITIVGDQEIFTQKSK